jgi:hypothetical protein
METVTDNSDSTSLWAVDEPDAVIRRMKVAVPVIGVAMTLVAVLWSEWHDALGVVIGTGLAIINFRFLSNSLRAILGAGHETAPPGTTLMFVFRWIIVGTVAYAILMSGVATIGGVFAGLFAPAVAIGLEAILQVSHTVRHMNDAGDAGAR